MVRKAIPDATQTNILCKSRRRCCLCFWLNGDDKVKKGQLAHLDGDNKNASEENLVFLCLDHHDEYDSIPRLSKGLRAQEVRKWRDELYKAVDISPASDALIRPRGLSLNDVYLDSETIDVIRHVFRLFSFHAVQGYSSSLLLGGPVFSGKLFLAKAACSEFDLPLLVTRCGELRCVGFLGQSDCLFPLGPRGGNSGPRGPSQASGWPQ